MYYEQQLHPPLPFSSSLRDVQHTLWYISTNAVTISPQNVLRELEQKKPQLDDLVKTAENLRESPIRQQIPEKGKQTLGYKIGYICSNPVLYDIS